jgi:hypothetical protein
VRSETYLCLKEINTFFIIRVPLFFFKQNVHTGTSGLQKPAHTETVTDVLVDYRIIVDSSWQWPLFVNKDGDCEL